MENNKLIKPPSGASVRPSTVSAVRVFKGFKESPGLEGYGNPYHLMLGTGMSNHIDMVRKGRSKTNHKNRKYGENNINHKLTLSQVEEIRRRYIPGKVRQKDIGDEFGVSQRLISVIVRNEGRNNG